MQWTAEEIRAARRLPGGDEVNESHQHEIAPNADTLPIGKAPPPEALPALEARLGALALEPTGPIIFDAPTPRPDGFDQRAVDAAKAVLLAPVLLAPAGKRSGR